MSCGWAEIRNKERERGRLVVKSGTAHQESYGSFIGHTARLGCLPAVKALIQVENSANTSHTKVTRIKRCLTPGH